MMKLETMEDFPACKGKRTKRPRPSSSTSSNGGGAEYSNSLVSSPTTSSGMSTTTQEDEDMANCLILLARGNSPSQTKTTESKFSSRRFAEIATTTNGKVGICVYECKTCNRTFPSFQALGGHRASHKRPKTAADDDHKKSPPDNQEDEKRRLPPPPSTQLLSKIHECSICGSEFASGQALGGHMRRHRPATNGTASHDVAEKPRNVFALDLNLPAPPEDEKFQQFPAKQQPQIVFSAAPLVDCHY